MGAILAAAALAAEPGTHVAGCDRGPVTIGAGKPGWRRSSLSAGPVGVAKGALGRMAPYSRRRPKQLVGKVPILIEGHEPVVISVPSALYKRVFLYYGFHRGPDGSRSTSFYDYSGNSQIEFQPCPGRPRTIWPGGIRTNGRPRVRLLVQVGKDEPTPLPLGRPTVLR
jgi:hypothetical protein